MIKQTKYIPVVSKFNNEANQAKHYDGWLAPLLWKRAGWNNIASVVEETLFYLFKNHEHA